MAIDKRKSILNAPTLRFPEFSGEWRKFALGEICSGLDYGMNAAAKEYDGKNKYIRITDIDESTSKYNQSDIVSPDGVLEVRYLVRDNDILFARTGASTGKTYLYNPTDGQLYYAGFLIRANVLPENNSRFVFLQTQLKRYWKWVLIMSARSGQPGINSQEYSHYSVFLPKREEQDKVAHLFELLDERIATQIRIIEEQESLIIGYLQRISTRGKANGTWKDTFLRDVLKERKETNVANHPVYSVSVSKGVVNQIEYLGRSFAAKDTSNYNVAHKGDVIYTKSPTGSFPYGIIKQSFVDVPVAISPLYGVYVPVNYHIGNILHFYFLTPSHAQNYLHPLIQKGAKNTINITNEHFLNNKVLLPLDAKDASKCAELLNALQTKIELEKRLMRSYQQQKQFLLSQMFI